ncbi:hypothetical protein [Saccharothrix hoggarensis]|uniref:Uncharacterized protein n=1 Tax=Saccharothrix hoggarensis TaxID=913853 RepID=A0ABW3QSX2_9PSEU
MRDSVPLVTFRRRSDTACETAQKLADDRHPSWPAGLMLMVRLPRVRQKLTSAMQLPVPPSARQRL